MFDVFYFDKKPNLFVHEQWARDIEHARALSRTTFFWVVNYLLDYKGFDFLWEPVPWQAGQKHVWPSQHQPDSGTWLVPKKAHTDINYHIAPRLTSTVDMSLWQIPQGIDRDSFDWTWHPSHSEPAFMYQFGTQHQSTGGPTYIVPGADQIKYIPEFRVVKTSIDRHWQIPDGLDHHSFDWTWHPNHNDPPYIYQFGTQHQSTGGPRYCVPGATEVKYIRQHRAVKVSVDPNWQIPSGVELDDFDWTWHPNHNDPPYIYQFGTQHQRTGGPRYCVSGATDVKFVENIAINAQKTATVIVEIDHLDGHSGKVVGAVKKFRYFDNYRDTLIRIARNLVDQHQFVWICSSICDYSDFDFSWHPEQWQSQMLHVFASNDQKFGDTFFMNVPAFLDSIEKKALLEWADLNFVEISVPRRPMPVFVHDHDSQVTAVKNQEFTAPLALFTTEQHLDQPRVTVPLWRSETKTIVPVSGGATAVIVPKAAVGSIQQQLYDWPHIDKTRITVKSQPLDIVFVSNGEPNADENFQILRNRVAFRTNRLRRVDGITGRVAAYHAAARASTTPWFFAVFAKLRQNTDFDWDWQPDRMQQAKHYIFHARNPVNGLVYGHQAMIAYNQQLVLDNSGVGLDFTLDSPHEVVPVVSGTAYYNTSAWSAWRTAFREVVKLRHSLPDVENEYRISQWLKTNQDQAMVFEDWSRWGAEDALDYYDSVGGDFEKLRLSYDWAWLASYAFVKRGLTTAQ